MKLEKHGKFEPIDQRQNRDKEEATTLRELVKELDAFSDYPDVKKRIPDAPTN